MAGPEPPRSDAGHAVPPGLQPRAKEPGRAFFVDNLRAAVVLGLVVFHTARVFDGETWHIKDAHSYLAADIVVGTFNAFAMPLLFLLAGYAASSALSSRGLPAFARERMLRLFVPFAIGIFLFVLPQVYLERIAPTVPATMSPARLSAGFTAFLPQFLDCCYPAANFSYHHLWFLLYLLVHALVLGPVVFAFRRWPKEGLPATVAAAFERHALAVAALALVIAEVVLRPRFPSTHAFVDDFANHAHFAWALLAGAYLAASSRTRARLGRWGPALLWIGANLLVVALVNATLWRFISGPAWIATRTLTECLLVGGLFGTFLARLDRPVPLLTRFAPLGMPFYLVHQTIIVALAFALLGWSGLPLAKFLVIAATAMFLSLAFAAVAARWRLTRFIVGMPAVPRGAAADGPLTVPGATADFGSALAGRPMS